MTEAFRYYMIRFKSLNEASLSLIANIVNNARNHPNYRTHDISSYTYDASQGVKAIEISKGGSIVNLWLFFPGINGEIESIACYGKYLTGHYQAIKNSMSVFGLPVMDVSIEQGSSPYVDITLDDY